VLGKDRLILVFWGTYDLSKPRNRILLKGLRAAGVEVIECHFDLWRGVEDKSQVKGVWPRLQFLLRWLAAYPILITRYLFLPSHDAVLLGYLGQLDALMIRPFASLRRIPVVWDVLMSLYVATVEDRKLLSPSGLFGHALYTWEWLALRAADRLIMSNVHSAAYLTRRFGLPQGLTTAVFIGAETECFPRRPWQGYDSRADESNESVNVLFYGTFIPSHGVTTIIEAAHLLRDYPINWTLIGQGQEAKKIDASLAASPLPNLRRIVWVPYADLARWIHRADLCLGFFGAGERANHALANKIFQILATGTPLVTRDSPAIRQLLDPSMPGVYLIPPENPAALAEAVLAFTREKDQLARQELHLAMQYQLQPETIGAHILSEIRRMIPAGHHDDIDHR